MKRLTEMTINAALHRLDRGEISAVELTRAYLDAIASRNERLNAFVHVAADEALAAALASDERRKRGEALPLDGIPLGIKDNFATAGLPMRAGSHILDGFVPPYESTVTERLRAAGAVFLGKLNMDEFAMGSSNETSYDGPVVSPWKRREDSGLLVPGGSSGGSAAAVSACLALAATGTDTGGSIRQPAAFCGLVGLKPTYGRCSRFGIVAFASSLDQAGPITRDVRDAATMLKVMSGHDAKDSTSAPLAVPDFEAALGRDLTGLRIGIPREYRVDGTPKEINALWDRGIAWLQEQGAEVVDISLPMTPYALAAYYIIAPAEACSNLARYDGVRFGLRVPGETLDEMYENTRAEGFGAEVKRRLLIGTYVLSEGYYDAYYLKAQRVRTLIARDFATAFKRVDAILTPTTPSAAFAIGEKTDDPLSMYLNDIFTVPVNLAGLPAMSVPAGLSSDGLPLGLQVIGRPFDEETMLRVAYALEGKAHFDAVPAMLTEDSDG